MKIFSWIILCLMLVSCSNRPKLDLSVYEMLVINDKPLSDIDAEDIVYTFMELKPTTYSISDDPSFIIYAYPDDSESKYDLYTVFLPLKLVYPGDHFEAWANNMKGKKSKCFILDEFAIEVLNRYK